MTSMWISSICRKNVFGAGAVAYDKDAKDGRRKHTCKIEKLVLSEKCDKVISFGNTKRNRISKGGFLCL
ncbi:MAG: hypothetical protein HFI07_15425 [Lachnospiraceae bacterium]|nr:hypothetical protein [Lachnospiraceae bacterium]